MGWAEDCTAALLASPGEENDLKRIATQLERGSGEDTAHDIFTQLNRLHLANPVHCIGLAHFCNSLAQMACAGHLNEDAKKNFIELLDRFVRTCDTKHLSLWVGQLVSACGKFGEACVNTVTQNQSPFTHEHARHSVFILYSAINKMAQGIPGLLTQVHVHFVYLAMHFKAYSLACRVLDLGVFDIGHGQATFVNPEQYLLYFYSN